MATRPLLLASIMLATILAEPLLTAAEHEKLLRETEYFLDEVRDDDSALASRLVLTIGTAIETSTSSISPNVSNGVNWLTDAPMFVTVETNSSLKSKSKPAGQSQCGNSCGIESILMPSRASKLKY